jgi:hypothetical protein
MFLKHVLQVEQLKCGRLQYPVRRILGLIHMDVINGW